MTTISLPHFQRLEAARPALPTIHLLGMPLHAVTEPQAVNHILSEIRQGRGGWVITPNLDHLRRYTREPVFAAHFRQASLIVADGMPLVWASRVQKTPLPQRVTGADLIHSLSAAAAVANIPIYLLGGSAGAAEAAAGVLQKRHPELPIAGVECPPVGFEKDPAYMNAMACRLLASRPGIIFVALGSPKQEQVIARLRHFLPSAWWLGVGISFSFVSGEVKRAPFWMRRRGLEWLHRLTQEPRRLAKRYLIDDLPFMAELFHGAMDYRLRQDDR